MALESSKPPKRLHIRFPQEASTSKTIPQDEETCEIVEGDKVTTVRFHDYAQVFSIPGLYDQLFGGPDSETKCISPQVIAGLLNEHLPSIKTRNPVSHNAALHNDGKSNVLRILDFGAGNGMIGEEIRRSVHLDNNNKSTLWQNIFILGWDILPEAKQATARDRPGIYNDYTVADINKHNKTLTPSSTDNNTNNSFDILTAASALSFGGNATLNAFKAAASLIRPGGLLIFNLNEKALDVASLQQEEQQQHSTSDNHQPASGQVPKAKPDGFLGMLSEAMDNNRLTILETKRYCHRLSVTGKELYYVAVVALKHGDLG
ncbi:MAG: hypothetical protein GOMPHAMPRED_002366 [Gomphillus americanus]|uniref:Methyltransferase type 11 domain-containing protein n=1 Tax=Gomphillus americanus TaxID=1940652 RepID=A0A8H3FIQ9_9LECA|nr:MAG: hypothetical protein GOMPHAMPRED_002366 [Gomphillus americanus]